MHDADEWHMHDTDERMHDAGEHMHGTCMIRVSTCMIRVQVGECMVLRTRIAVLVALVDVGLARLVNAPPMFIAG